MKQNNFEDPAHNIPDKHGAKPGWKTYLAFALLFIFLFTIGWGMQHSSKGSVKIGKPAPEFELLTFNGEQVSLDTLQGKVILLNFWSSWCSPCELEAPELENAWQNLGNHEEVIFVGIAHADTESAARDFAARYNYSFPNGRDLGSKIADAYRVRAVPESFLIDPEGIIVAIKFGPFQSADEIITFIENGLN